MRFRKNKEIAYQFSYHGVLFDLEGDEPETLVALGSTLAESRGIAKMKVAGTGNQILIREQVIKPNRPSTTTDIELVGDWG